MSEWFEAPAWEERYAQAGAVFSGQVNPQLVAEVADLPAGSARRGGSTTW